MRYVGTSPALPFSSPGQWAAVPWAAWLAASAMACGAGQACAQTASGELAATQVLELAPTVVTATRLAQSVLDIPASVDVLSGAKMREAGPLLNLSESLARVPGLAVLNRQNLAQDLQITSRGFGARSAFGVRGVRLYEDGIPLTMPDGQGQSSSFDLSAAQRIEVLRGPASALYGNASGGVIQLFTEDGPPVPEVTAGQAYSRDGFTKTTVKAAGQKGVWNYVVDASQADTDGYRDHSSATRYQLHTRMQWALDAASTFTFVGGSTAMPMVEDPLGLTAAQWASNPRQAGAGAEAYNTRKAIYNTQVGGIYERQLGQDSVRLMLYGGTREATQYQSIAAPPASTLQNAPGHPGGVIDLRRHFWGLDARYTLRTQVMARPLSMTGGVNVDQLGEHRQGFQNFDAITGQLGVEGTLRRSEDNTAHNNDQYLLAQWELDPAWQLSAGLRHSRVAFTSKDHYVVTGNGDDSGRMDFAATTPTGSVLWCVQPDVNVYATVGRSFETPTLNEVAYQGTSGTTTGWNTALKASSAQHSEAGVKARVGAAGQLNLAAFRVDTNDEIAVRVNASGRAVYQNVGHTHRRGLEASSNWKLAPGWSAYASAAWTQANYADAFTSTSAGSTTTVNPGNALPGVPRRTAFAEVVWRPAPQGWHAAAEWRHSGRIWANDIHTEFAPSYQMLALRTGWRQSYGAWRVEALARIDNLANAHTVGSVIVNEGSGRYYEPAPGRSATLATYVTRSF